MAKCVPGLPIEIWAEVFKYLSGPELYQCRQVCDVWNQEISNMMFHMKIGTRGLRCERLKLEQGAICEHRRGIWDSISLKTDKPVWLTSVGVFTPSGHTAVAVAARPIKHILDHIDVSAQLNAIYEQEGATMSLFGNGKRGIWDSISLKADKTVWLTSVGVFTPSGHTAVAVDARPVEKDEKNLRRIDVETELDSIHEQEKLTMSLFGKEGSGKLFRFQLEADEWWEIVLNISPQRRKFDSPSIWSGSGTGGKEEVTCYGVKFTFRETVREGWRSELESGQIPYFYFWPV